jgi:hypothetical protein
LLRSEFELVIVFEFLRNRLPKIQVTSYRWVFRVALINCFLGGFPDMFRRLKVRFPKAQVNNIKPFAPELPAELRPSATFPIPLTG